MDCMNVCGRSRPGGLYDKITLRNTRYETRKLRKYELRNIFLKQLFEGAAVFCFNKIVPLRHSRAGGNPESVDT